MTRATWGYRFSPREITLESPMLGKKGVQLLLACPVGTIIEASLLHPSIGTYLLAGRSGDVRSTSGIKVGLSPGSQHFTAPRLGICHAHAQQRCAIRGPCPARLLTVLVRFPNIPTSLFFFIVLLCAGSRIIRFPTCFLFVISLGPPLSCAGPL